MTASAGAAWWPPVADRKRPHDDRAPRPKGYAGGSGSRGGSRPGGPGQGAARPGDADPAERGGFGFRNEGPDQRPQRPWEEGRPASAPRADRESQGRRPHGSHPSHGAPAYGPRRDGPPPAYGPRRDGPPPAYGPRRDGPPPAYGPRRDGPPPAYGPRRDGPPPAYGPRRDGPPPAYGPRRDGPPPAYGPRRDGPPPAYGPRRDGPPPAYGPRRDGPPPHGARPPVPRPPRFADPPGEPIVVDAPDSIDDGPPLESGRPIPTHSSGAESRRDYRQGPDRRPYRQGPDRRPHPGPDRPQPYGQRYGPRSPIGGGPSVALGEDEELVAGRRPVEEAFVARREAKRLLVVPQRRMALEKLVLHATSLRIPVVEVEGGTLTAVAGFDGHQGIALVVAPRRWASPDEVLALAAERSEPPLVLVLDSLEDPQNVGTLLRSAEATGVHGAIFPTHRQAPLTPAAVKASAGAVEHLRLAPVDDLAGALADLHARGLRIVGADGDAPLTARAADLRGPIAIVVGSEGRGLGTAVRRRCDLLVRIPMHGRIESLNAAVAGSILLYEAAAQRRLEEAPRHSPPAEDGADEPPEAFEPGTEPVEPATAEVVDSDPAPRRPRRVATAKPDPEPGRVSGTPASDAEELLPGGPAIEPPEPAADPADDVPEV